MPRPFLYEYVPMGLTDIAVLDSSFEESEAGYGSHKANETIVARKGNQFVKISVVERATFGFNGKRSFGIHSEEFISEETYRELSSGKPFIDNPADVAEVRRHHAAIARRYQIENKLDEVAPKCPRCASPTHYKSGRYGPFWGCIKYPECDGTVRMSSEERTLYREWAGE